jgi:ABC-2 type transport system ATP-binding protein
LPKLDNVKKRIYEMLELVELNERSKEPVENYSGGMKRRLAISRALLTDPDILLLDEPTLGVDVQGTHKIWEYIQRFGTLGKTVLVTTNIMQEADLFCDNVLIMDHGKKIVQGSPLELKSQLGDDKIVISLKPQNTGGTNQSKGWRF